MDTQPTPRTRVLAFTPSRGRPLLLDHCIKQMQAQTHPVDHYIFLNTPAYAEVEDLKSLAALLVAENPEPKPPVITVGESTRQTRQLCECPGPGRPGRLRPVPRRRRRRPLRAALCGELCRRFRAEPLGLLRLLLPRFHRFGSVHTPRSCGRDSAPTGATSTSAFPR